MGCPVELICAAPNGELKHPQSATKDALVAFLLPGQAFLSVHRSRLATNTVANSLFEDGIASEISRDPSESNGWWRHTSR